MEEIEIKIREKSKKGRKFTLFNFREELVNFMYKKTVADSSRSSLRFFVLIFFLSLKVGDESLLFKLFNENLEKLQKLNTSFSKKEKLKGGEYADLVEKFGLQNIFRYDIFFILVETIVDSEEILQNFKVYFSNNPEIKKEFLKVLEKFKLDLDDFSFDFKGSYITDDRWDDYGEYHDLSKSVYRTIKMRTSRQIDLSLHKYAEVQVIKSESPIELSLLQHVKPQIIFDLWDTYKLGDYVKEVWTTLNQNPVVSAFTAQILADKYLKWRAINGRTHRKEKLKAKLEFEAAKNDTNQSKELLELTKVLVASVLKSNEHLEEEISLLKHEKDKVRQDKVTSLEKKEKKIKLIREKIERLENIDITTKKKD